MGWDVGGAEHPYDIDRYQVIDKVAPMDFDLAPHDWYKRNLNDGNWALGLEERPLIYVGRVIRYVEMRQLPTFARQLRSIVMDGGSITIFDYLPTMEMVMAELLVTGMDIARVELINPQLDPEDPAEWKVVLTK
jgi:hypothetical protein